MLLRVSRAILIVLISTLSFGCILSAQPIQPVFTTTSLDGQLIGLEVIDLKFGLWQPIAAIGVPTDFSKIPDHIRFKAGIINTYQYELPVVGEELGNFRAAVVNWPSTPVLGREGQTGIELGADLGTSKYRAFVGNLWPVNEDDVFTPAGLISTSTTQSFSLPFSSRLTFSSSSVQGVMLPPTENGLTGSFENLFEALGNEDFTDKFNSANYTLTLSIQGLILSGRFGYLTNPAELNRFEFVTGVRGGTQPLRGHQYWNLTFERRFNMYETSLPLNLPVQFRDFPFIPRQLDVSLDGRLFFQGAAATFEVEVETGDEDSGNSLPPPVAQPTQADEQEPEPELQTDMLFSWGLSTTLTVYEFRVRAEIIINQEGETKFSFTF